MASSVWRSAAHHIGPAFFRRRDVIAPTALIAVVLLSRREDFFLTAALDPRLAALGALTIATGLALRVVVVATTGIRRSGVHKELAVPTLIESGPYACCRNPLYVGNAAILIGLTAIYDSRVLLLALPLALLAIRSLVAAEERVLRRQFGAQYLDYCAQVPRFVPRRVRPVVAAAPRWRRALRKEHGTIFAAASAVIVLLGAEHLRRFGSLGHRHGWMLVAAWALSAALWAAVRALKHTGRLADAP